MKYSEPLLTNLQNLWMAGQTPLVALLSMAYFPDQVSSTARLFADDCLLHRNINATADSDQLQDDIDWLQKWEADWLLEFNPDK